MKQAKLPTLSEFMATSGLILGITKWDDYTSVTITDSKGRVAYVIKSNAFTTKIMPFEVRVNKDEDILNKFANELSTRVLRFGWFSWVEVPKLSLGDS